MLNAEIVVRDGVVDDFAEISAFLRDDFEADEIESELENFGDFDDIVIFDKLITRVDHEAEWGIFADGLCV